MLFVQLVLALKNISACVVWVAGSKCIFFLWAGVLVFTNAPCGKNYQPVRNTSVLVVQFAMHMYMTGLKNP